ncbi:MAG: protein kinase [Acidobacteriota bacterium]
MSDPGSTVRTSEAGRPVVEPGLPNGTVLAGRYMIVRFIGRGGMGEVYEADDSLLRQRVALKTLLDASLQDAGACDRFRHEVQLARQVTHPNVCRVYDMGCHQIQGATPQREIQFLTMEILEGETLLERIRRQGALDEAEALPIIRQIAEGLTAAHAQGILHRDLKSSNVILSGGPGAALRAVVTDFGLARPQDAKCRSYSAAGAIAGTLEYMSPEQLRGEDLTPSSDVYSLGVVIYEMVTGSVPFSGASPIAAAIKSVVERPPSPRLLAPDLSTRWEETILRCLSQSPADRYASPLDVVSALSIDKAAPRTFGELVPPASRRRVVLIGLAVLLCLLAIGAVLVYRRNVERPGSDSGRVVAPGVHEKRVRPTVVLLSFKNLSGRTDTQWISTALSEMLSAEIAASPDLRCLPGETAARMRTDLDLPDADSLSAETLARVRRACGADQIVLGSYLATGVEARAHLRLDVRVQECATGDTARVITLEGDISQITGLVAQAGADLRETLGAPALSAGQTAAASASRPAEVSTARYYAEGLDRLRRFDALGARASLQKAADAEPAYPLAHLALSDTWLALGYSGLAEQEAKKAHELSGNMSSESRLWIEGRYRERARDWSKAIEAYKVLRAEFPDSIEDGLHLAIAQMEAGREKDALKTLDELRSLPSPLGDDPRIFIAESSVEASLGDAQGQLDAATRAVEAARAAGGSGSHAEALMLQGEAFGKLHRYTDALRCYTNAADVWKRLGNRPGEIMAIISIAGVRRDTGSLDEAKKLYAEARKDFRGLGDRRGEAWSLAQKAIALRLQEDLGGADETFEEALLIAQEAGNDETAAAVLNNLAVVAWLRGNRDESRKRTEEAIGVCRRLADGVGECRALQNYTFMLMQDGELATASRISKEATAAAKQQDGILAETLLCSAECDRLRGEIPAARVSAEKALDLARSRDNRTLQASALHVLGAILYEQDDRAGARRCYQESLSIRQETGDQRGALATHVALGHLDIGDGKPAAAEAAARKALELAGGSRRPENPGTAASDLLALSLLARGEIGGAEQAAQQAVAFLARGASLDMRIAGSITMAQVRARAGNPAQARTILASARADAERAGLRIREIEVWLAEAEVEAAAGRSGDAAQLRKSAAELAEPLGLLRLARRARSG